MLKEVVAVGGDVVEVTNSGVFINNSFLRDSIPLDKPELPRLRGRIELKDKEIWVFGAGASPELAKHSFDSRYFGPITVQSVMGVQAASLDLRVRENLILSDRAHSIFSWWQSFWGI